MKALLRFVAALAFSSLAGLFSLSVVAKTMPVASNVVHISNDPLTLGNIGRIYAVNNYLQSGGYSNTNKPGDIIGVEWIAPSGIYRS